MALRQLRYYDDEVLRKKCKEVKEIDDHIRLILNDMVDTLHSIEDGVAIAAPQVGILKRLVVIDMGKGLIKLINPVIIEEKGTQHCIEGCLSFPGRIGKTIRPKNVIVKAFNENGKEITLKGNGDMAKCLCHEIDHLDGILFIDKVTKWI